MKLKHGFALLTALIIAPFAATARALAPSGVDALNVQGFHDGAFSRSAEVALSAHLLVTHGTAPGTQVKLCTATTRPIGSVYDDTLINQPVGVIPILSGPKILIASKAIAAGVRVFATAGGKVTDAVVSGAYLVGESLTAAAGDGSEFEVLPLSPVVNP
jgi:hypothetical protein